MTKNLTSDERRGAFLSLLSVVFFVANILVLKALNVHAEAVDGWVGTVTRGVVGLAILTLVFRGSQGLKWKALVTHPLLLVRGIIGATTIAILYLTVDHLGAGRALILNQNYPLFAGILAAILLKESLGWRGGLCLLAGFVGLILFLGSGMDFEGVSFWDGLALLGAFLAGLVVLLIRHLRHDFQPPTIYAAQCLFSVVIAIPVCGGKVAAVTPTAWGFLAVAATLVTAGQLLLTHAFRVISVAKGSGVQMLLPPITAAGGMLFFGESYTALEAIGAVVTLGATWLLLNTRSPQPKDSPMHPLNSVINKKPTTTQEP